MTIESHTTDLPSTVERPHVTDTRAVNIGATYRLTLAAEDNASKSLGDLEAQWIALGGMLIDVRLERKGQFGKWLQEHETELGFRRTKAYELIAYARHGTPITAVGDARRGNAGYYSLYVRREGAVERARKHREKIKDQLARLEAFEQTEREKPAAMARKTALRESAIKEGLDRDARQLAESRSKEIISPFVVSDEKEHLVWFARDASSDETRQRIAGIPIDDEVIAAVKSVADAWQKIYEDMTAQEEKAA